MLCRMLVIVIFFVKQKTAYEMRISDWSSDVCSSDLAGFAHHRDGSRHAGPDAVGNPAHAPGGDGCLWRRCRTGAAAGSVPVAQIGRASCRERVCQYSWNSVGAVSLKSKISTNYIS